MGYYVYNNYKSEENIENEPEEVIISDIQRSILSDKPRITRFSINWGDEASGQVEEESQQNNYDFMFANPEEEVMKDAQKKDKQEF